MYKKKQKKQIIFISGESAEEKCFQSRFKRRDSGIGLQSLTSCFSSFFFVFLFFVVYLFVNFSQVDIGSF